MKKLLMLSVLLSGLTQAAPSATLAKPTTASIINGGGDVVNVCKVSCRANLSTAKSYAVTIGPMPLGQFQINNLAIGKYEAGINGFPMKSYVVGRDGVLNGSIEKNRGSETDNTPSIDHIAYCSTTACYANFYKCSKEAGYECIAVTF